MFMLDGEYTLEDVKKQRNRMLKAFHPDNDSSIDSKYGEKINACYEVLLNEIKKRSQI